MRGVLLLTLTFADKFNTTISKLSLTSQGVSFFTTTLFIHCNHHIKCLRNCN